MMPFLRKRHLFQLKVLLTLYLREIENNSKMPQIVNSVVLNREQIRLNLWRHEFAWFTGETN